MRRSFACVLLGVVAACGGGDSVATGGWAGGNANDGSGGGADASTSAPFDAGRTITPANGDDDGGAPGEVDATAGDARDGAAPGGAGHSKIEHVVIIVQENHTFDSYFGRYCTAPAGSDPACTTGPSCCEAAPDTEPSGASPKTLDDTENAAYDPNHTQSCELGEMNGGAMDKYVAGSSCSDARNFAIADDATMKPYHDYAKQYALADRYFQPIVGQSSSNDMYFAQAQYVFTDNAFEPASNGHGCSLTRTTTTYTGRTTIADVLLGANRTFAFYAQGYQAMLDATLCPLPPSDCPAHIPTAPCDYDPGDVPFEYYEQFVDNPLYMKDFDQLGKDVVAGTLPDVAFVKGLQYHNEHPGYGTTISAGATFVRDVVDSLLASPYGANTLVLVTWDEGGGLFDHVKPPPSSPADHQPYGTRVPLLALGPFAKANHVSHVVMEHSSVVKFLEWNFTGETGQLGGRDAIVNNLGDLLDPQATGVAVPAD
jgi:phospholipase C